VDEAVNDAAADEPGEGRFVVAAAGDDQHQVGKLTFDLRQDRAGCGLQGLGVEDQDADLAGEQQMTDLVLRGHVPETACSAHRLAQGLQEQVIRREDDQLHDVPRMAEPRRMAGALVSRSYQMTVTPAGVPSS
jgi:hypothetical protein